MEQPLIAACRTPAGYPADLAAELDRRYAGLTTELAADLTHLHPALALGARVRVLEFVWSGPSMVVEIAARPVGHPDLDLFLDLADVDQDKLLAGHCDRLRADPARWSVADVARELGLRSTAYVRVLRLGAATLGQDARLPAPDAGRNWTAGAVRRWAMQVGWMDTAGRLLPPHPTLGDPARRRH